MARFVRELREQEETIGLGGGAAGIERQHAKGRLTARERIRALIDPATPFFELAILPPSGCTKSGAARRRARLSRESAPCAAGSSW